MAAGWLPSGPPDVDNPTASILATKATALGSIPVIMSSAPEIAPAARRNPGYMSPQVNRCHG